MTNAGSSFKRAFVRRRSRSSTYSHARRGALQQPREQCAESLPPVCGEFCPKMAHGVIIQSALPFKE